MVLLKRIGNYLKKKIWEQSSFGLILGLKTVKMH